MTWFMIVGREGKCHSPYYSYSTHASIYEKLKIIITIFLPNDTFCEWSYRGFDFTVIDRWEYSVPTVSQSFIFSIGIHNLKCICHCLIITLPHTLCDWACADWKPNWGILWRHILFLVFCLTRSPWVLGDGGGEQGRSSETHYPLQPGVSWTTAAFLEWYLNMHSGWGGEIWGRVWCASYVLWVFRPVVWKRSRNTRSRKRLYKSFLTHS